MTVTDKTLCAICDHTKAAHDPDGMCDRPSCSGAKNKAYAEHLFVATPSHHIVAVHGDNHGTCRPHTTWALDDRMVLWGASTDTFVCCWSRDTVDADGKERARGEVVKETTSLREALAWVSEAKEPEVGKPLWDANNPQAWPGSEAPAHKLNVGK